MIFSCISQARLLKLFADLYGPVWQDRVGADWRKNMKLQGFKEADYGAYGTVQCEMG